MGKVKYIAALILLSAFILSAGKTAFAQEEEHQYIHETGHWISGEFLKYYQNSPNALLLLGYPITDAFEDELTKTQIQYFQKARLELHMEAADGKRIKKTPLGEYIYESGNIFAFPTDTAACRYFDQTDHTVCYEFLNFFDAYGGIEEFGYPISDLEIFGNYFVQYFQNTRMEWHPELPPGERVVLANLGRVYFDKRGENIRLLPPSDGINLPQSILCLQTRAFVSQVIVPQSFDQTLYVIVRDQKLKPVSHAPVSATVILPSGEEKAYLLNPTDASGITQLTFSLKDQPPGEVIDIRVISTYGDIESENHTWFRVWW